jgi:hypothetical protein
MDKGEQTDALVELRELQAYGAARAAERGISSEDISRLVQDALTDPDPVAVAEARAIVARRFGHRSRAKPVSAMDPALLAAWRAAVAELDAERVG